MAELSYIKVWWLLMTAIAMGLVLGLGTLEAIRLLALPLAILIFAVTLGAALNPLVSRLERRIPRALAALLTYLIVLILLGALIWAVIPTVIEQVQALVNLIPDLTQRVRDFLDRWDGMLTGDTFANTIASQLENFGPTLLRVPLTITSGVSLTLLILFLSFYLLLDASRIQNFVLSLFPEGRRERVDEVMVAMGQAMGGYFSGVVIDGAIVGLITFVGLLIIGVDFALVFGVLTGILELIPIAGPIIAMVIIVGLTLLQSPGQALVVLIFFVILQQVENNILVPQIMRSQTEVSPLLSILAIFAGGAIGGLLGALIAIPIAAALRVFIRMVIAPAIRRQTGAEPPEGSSE